LFSTFFNFRYFDADQYLSAGCIKLMLGVIPELVTVFGCDQLRCV